MIKVGFLIAYDYYLLFPALNLVYNSVDKIFISIDKDRVTWSGNHFSIPDRFFEEIRRFDTENKIIFHEDCFYNSKLSLTERETRQRILLHKRMGYGWKVFLDVDEYVYDFVSVAAFLRRYKVMGYLPLFFPIMLRGKLITLFKKDIDGFYFINNHERFSFITNQNRFKNKRNNKSIKNFYTNITVIHQSWAREEQAIWTKLSNWGHKYDFDTHKYFEFWKSINSENYNKLRDFHPIKPKIWNKLEFLKSTDIYNFIESYSNINPQKINPIGYKIWIKSLFRLNK